MPFSPSAEAAFDGQKGVVAGIGRPSGLLGAIHVWQRVPKSLAGCVGTDPCAQGAVGAPESGGRHDKGRAEGVTTAKESCLHRSGNVHRGEWTMGAIF